MAGVTHKIRVMEFWNNTIFVTFQNRVIKKYIMSIFHTYAYLNEISYLNVFYEIK
jgi:hypothetical protein